MIVRHAHTTAEPQTGADQVSQVRSVFHTPLNGAYCWNYRVDDAKVHRLYRLGTSLNWNADADIQWHRPLSRDQSPMLEAVNPMLGYTEYERLSRPEQIHFAWHNFAWLVSQFLHGEQGALLVASQLVSCAPNYEAKLYAASQAFDEARHVEVFARYLDEQVGVRYPCNPMLKALLDKILSDERWDLKFIGMQIVVEGLALAAFKTLKLTCADPLFCELLENVMRDESRHVAFGITYLERHIRALAPHEREQRARFAYEACVVMRERLIANEVFEHFGWDVAAARQKVLESQVMAAFRHVLFERIIPNLKRVGLLTDAVRPLYDALGVLEFEALQDDAEQREHARAEPDQPTDGCERGACSLRTHQHLQQFLLGRQCQVGAVIVGEGNVILSTGFNGFARHPRDRQTQG